jgi:hypothetical protein
VQRIALRYASHEYRAAARHFHAGESEVAPERPAATEVPLVVYRGPEKLHFLDLEPAAFALLEALGRGCPLEEACETAAQAAGEEASTLEPRVGAWFQHWTSLGWVSAIRF